MPNFPQIKDIPITLIATVKKWPQPPMLLFTDKGRELMGQWHTTWVETFPQGKAVLTTNSYHYIHRDNPQLVLKEAGKLLQSLNK